MAVQLGAALMKDIRWANPLTIRVDFTTSDATKPHQLYSGRSLIGYAPAGQTAISATFKFDASTSPPHFQLVTLDQGEDSGGQHGSKFPSIHANKYRLSWTSTGSEADTKRFNIFRGDTTGDTTPTTAAGAVDYVGDGSYTHDVSTLSPGDWTYRVIPVDDAIPNGNSGTNRDITFTSTAYPVDIGYQTDGTRFAVTDDAGADELTISFN